MSELELEERMKIKILFKLGKNGNEIRVMFVQAYGDNAMNKTAVYKWVIPFYEEEKVSLTKRDQDGEQHAELKVLGNRVLEKMCRYKNDAATEELRKLHYAPTMWPATGRQHRGCIVPQAVTQSLVLLKMGKIISRNMLS